MRIPPLLAICAALVASTGCQLGKQWSGPTAKKERDKETWNAPKFGDEGGFADGKTSKTIEQANAAARNGRYAEARRLYDDVLRDKPGDADAHHGLAILADRDQNYPDAEEHYLAALNARPNDPDLLNDVGYSYLLQDRRREAKQMFVKVLELDPQHKLATSNLGHLNALDGKYDAALALFRRVGTEEQALAELARYQARPPADPAAPATRPDPNAFAGDPGPKDIGDLSFDEMQKLREQARMEGIAARQRRNNGFDPGPLDAFDREGGVPAPRGNPFEEPPVNTARNPFEGGSAPRDNRVQPIGFETEAPRNPAPGPPARDPRGFSLGQPGDGGFSAPPATAPAATTPPGTVPPTNPAAQPADGLWPPRNNTGTAPAFGGGPPWPSATSEPMGDRMSTSVQPARRSHEGPVIRPNPIQQRAAVLGLNAGVGLPVPIESSATHTTNRPAVVPAHHSYRHPDPPPFESSPAARGPVGRVAPAGHVAPAQPPATAPAVPARSADAAGRVIPDQWPDAVSGGPRPIATTAQVPTHDSLYRGADGALSGFEADHFERMPPSPHLRGVEEWPNRPRAAEQRQAEFEAERRAFQGSGPAPPQFPPDFAPPTTLPRTRDENRTGW